MKRRTVPRPLSAVGLVDPGLKGKYGEDFVFVFLGELPNIPGECTVAGWQTGRIYAPCDTKDFVELTVSKPQKGGNDL